MQKQSSLEKLRVLELSILLEHLRLGKEHLRKYLNNKQFAELQKFDGLSEEQKENIKTETTEKAGNFALVLNTAFTCALGAWLGTAGFIGMGIGSHRLLLIVIVASALISAYLGYVNYQAIKNTARDAILNQKLHHIQCNIVKLINSKRRKHIEKNIHYLNHTLLALDNHTQSSDSKEILPKIQFESKEEISDWLNRLNAILEQKANALSEDALYEIYLDELANSKLRLKNLLSKNITIKEENPDNKQDNRANLLKENWSLPNKSEKTNFIEVLTDPTIATPRYHPKKRIWITTNFGKILVGLLPTILGGFGSMFLYFVGIPDIAKQFGIHWLKEITDNTYSKPIELAIALFITLYFGYTFIRSNYKSFQREQALEKNQKMIANEEAMMIEINAKLNLLRKLKQQISHIAHIFGVLKRLGNHLREKQVLLESYKEKYLSLEKKIAALQNGQVISSENLKN